MDDSSRKYLEEEMARIELRIGETKGLVDQLGEIATSELDELVRQRDSLAAALTGEKDATTASDTGENFNSIILEVRPGVGGEEAKIWADDLMRMYTRYANTRGWKVSELDEGVIKISGPGVYRIFLGETGVHRVQRVPETEAAGRIHTSTASVVVLPEVGEKQIEIRDDDLVWEFSRGGGHGGQNVNKVATAVRLTHKPSGVVVGSRQERSQEQNRKIALSLLRGELWEREQEKKNSEIADARSLIGRSMRAEKIRTYNYPQNRVTDHRLGQSWHKLDKIVEGDLGDITDAVLQSSGTDDQLD